MLLLYTRTDKNEGNKKQKKIIMEEHTTNLNPTQFEEVENVLLFISCYEVDE